MESGPVRMEHLSDTAPEEALEAIAGAMGTGPPHGGEVRYLGVSVAVSGWLRRAGAIATPWALGRVIDATRRREWLHATAEGGAGRTRMRLEFDLGARRAGRLRAALDALDAR